MKRYLMRGLSVFLTLLVLCSCIAVPAAAAGTSETATFWDASARFVSPLYGFISAYLEDDVTPETATGENWKSAYFAYIANIKSGLGTTVIDSAGALIYQPSFSDLTQLYFVFYAWSTSTRNSIGVNLAAIANPYNLVDQANLTFAPTSAASASVTVDEKSSGGFSNLRNSYFSISFKAPIEGQYYLYDRACSNYSYLLTGASSYVSGTYMTSDNYSSSSFENGVYKTPTHYNSGDVIEHSGYLVPGFSTRFIRFMSTIYLPVYKVVPISGPVDVGPTAPTYNINTRSGSLAGTYGYYGDNGKMIVGESVKLVDETNNTVYNPVTNTTTNVTDWTYDYSDRSYNVTTTTGDKITIMYGDENVTIQEGDVTYNVYYVTSGGSGGTDPDPTPDPGTCTHDYVATATAAPTCLVAGSKSLKCSKCSDTKTEAIPATGHTWIVDRTIQTSYDEQGNMVQQGYTIYKCGTCGEQYKDTDGVGPPGGNEEEKESFWDKIKNFFSSLTGGIFDAIVTVVGAIIDGLTKIIGKINEKIGVVIEAALKIFSSIPKLFQGFIDFLTAGFAFLPPEVVMIIEFGLLAVIAVAIIKIFI